MIVICGFTPTQLGKTLASATQRFLTVWCRPRGSTTLRVGSHPARTVPIGWNAVSLILSGATPFSFRSRISSLFVIDSTPAIPG
jgi:hypothetical protein